jgi:hypothetical protein
MRPAASDLSVDSYFFNWSTPHAPIATTLHLLTGLRLLPGLDPIPHVLDHAKMPCVLLQSARKRLSA